MLEDENQKKRGNAKVRPSEWGFPRTLGASQNDLMIVFLVFNE